MPNVTQVDQRSPQTPRGQTLIPPLEELVFKLDAILVELQRQTLLMRIVTGFHGDLQDLTMKGK